MSGDVIHAKVRRKVQQETKGCDTKDEKVRILIHRTIMDITERYGYSYNSFEKTFYTWQIPPPTYSLIEHN